MSPVTEYDIAASFVGHLVLSLIRHNRESDLPDLMARLTEARSDCRKIIQVVQPFTRTPAAGGTH